MSTAKAKSEIQTAIEHAEFVMLRFEIAKITPCTGIAAVTNQERRHFIKGVTVAPWCGEMQQAKTALSQGVVRRTELILRDQYHEFETYITTGSEPPIIFLACKDSFLGRDNPYDTQDLGRDSLMFGLAVDSLMRAFGSSKQFIWMADWETVPAGLRLRDRHHLALTLHNTFDRWLRPEAEAFGTTYQMFCSEKTALEVGLEGADVVTTVNRGFAYGMRHEVIQTKILAKHLQHLMGRVVGINNATFATLKQDAITLEQLLREDPPKGIDQLQRLKSEAVSLLPEDVRSKAQGKVIMATMGRRVAQKQHDVLVESVRQLLDEDPAFPILVIFATVAGDSGSPDRLQRIQALADRYPNNVVWTDGQLPYYTALMNAADYNCMPSLYEPHGGAFDGTIVPIARAIDGLAEQIAAYRPLGDARRMNDLWHLPSDQSAGFLFREQPDPENDAADLDALLNVSPSPNNSLFNRIVSELKATLTDAVTLRRSDLSQYGTLVQAALAKQQSTSWLMNLGGMLALIEEARQRRPL